MSEELTKKESEEKEYVLRLYNCPKCKLMHNIKLSKKLAENQQRFPFPYVFLHSSEENLEDLLTLLYLDAQLQIRAVEIIEVAKSNIFSEELAKQITDKLMDKIVCLEQENVQLKDLLGKVKADSDDEKIIEQKSSELKDFLDKLDFSKIEVFKIECSPVSSEENSESVEEPSKQENIEDQEHEEPTLEEETELVSEARDIEKPASIKTKTPIKEKTPAETLEKITVYLISTIGPGEKKQKLGLNINNSISDIKETVGQIYGLIPDTFHLSSGGITFDEGQQLKDYNVVDGDEILVIPSSTAGLMY